MLDERGIHWWAGESENQTRWESRGLTWEFEEDIGPTFLGVCENDVTPEQAIAATADAGTCHNTQNDFDFMCSECGKCVDNGRVLGFKFCPNCGRRIEASE